jgi:hypothetical protein
MLVRNLFFDFETTPPSDTPALWGEDLGDLFNPETTIAAGIDDDPASLAKAEREGILRYMPAGWYRNPGASLDHMGASGDPCKGLTFVLFLEGLIKNKLAKAFQEARDHHRTTAMAVKGMHPEGPARLSIQCTLSSVGGTGTGFMHWTLSGAIRSFAQKDGIQTKIILNVMTRGSLHTTDNEQADRNTYTTLKHCQVLASGKYVDPITGQIRPRPCDLLYLSSNQNSTGNITGFEPFLMHEAHTTFFFWHTPGGRKMRERLNDHEGIEYGRNGDPLLGFTKSSGGIFRDSEGIIEYCSQKATAILMGEFAAEVDPRDIPQQAAGQARIHGIYESSEDNDITSAMMRSEHLGKENVALRGINSFTDRIRGLKGLQKVAVALDAGTTIRNQDVPETFTRMIESEAETRLKTAQKGIEAYTTRMLRDLHGFGKARWYYEYMKLAAEESVRVITAKIDELQSLRQPHEQILAEAQDRIQRIEESNWVNRTLNASLIRRIGQSVEESTRAAIDYDVQLAACLAAVGDFLEPLLDWLNEKLEWLSMQEQKLQQAKHICQNKADNVADRPTDWGAPLGLALVDRDYLQDYMREYIEERRGSIRIAQDLLSRILTRYGSLAHFAEAPLEDLIEACIAVCDEVFRPVVKSTDVVSDFMRLFPDINKQRRIVQQLVLQTEGRYLVTGEVARPVPWIKAANVPSTTAQTWLYDLLESVDQKPGRWEVSIHPDPDRITICQLRGQISLTPHLRRLQRMDDPRSWEVVVNRAPDRVSALIVNPDPSLGEFRRVLAKAIAANLLDIDDNGNFALNCGEEEPLMLGKDFRAVRQKLQPRWPDMVFVESVFGRDIVVDDAKINSQLLEMCKVLKEKNTTDRRLTLINSKAVDESLKQVELITPWARRIREFTIDGEQE